MSFLKKFFSPCCPLAKYSDNDNKYINLFKEEVKNVPGKLDPSCMHNYYCEDLQVINNGEQLDFKQFQELYEKAFVNLKSITTKFDDIYAVGNRLSVRVTFTQHLGNGGANDVHIAILAEYKNDKIHRMWQTMYPLI